MPANAAHPSHKRGPNRRRPKTTGPAFAALDLGTNNCRMLIAEPSAEGFRVIDSFSKVVRLGEGLSTSERLSDAAMGRTLSALKICAGKLRRHGVRTSRGVATEACRRAVNAEGFLSAVERETGIRLEPITHDEEAALTLQGCESLLRGDHPSALVFDIGGGSTEIMWVDQSGDRAAIRDMISLPEGVVTLGEKFPPDPESGCDPFPAMVDHIDVMIADFDRRNGISREVDTGAVQMLGTSGTVTTLCGIHLGLKRYNRSRVDGQRMTFDDLTAVIDRLVELPAEQRREEPCIGQDRCDLMVVGCAILSALCNRWPVGELTIADRGIREGLLWNLLKQCNPEGVS